MFTPNDIEILIHYHCCPSEHPRADAPAVKEAIAQFLVDGILVKSESYDNSYDTTAKGCAWLKCILSVEYPKQAWVDSNGSIIDY